MNKTYDIYNLEEDLDDILGDIADNYDEPISYIRDCYELLIDRDGFLDYIKRNDDGLFYSCLFDLVSRRVLAENKMTQVLIDEGMDVSNHEDLYKLYNIETIDESVDNAIYNSYGLEAKRFLSQDYLESLGFIDSKSYEDFGVSRQGRVIVFKGGVPKDALKAE